MKSKPFEVLDVDLDGDIVSTVDNENFKEKKKHYITVLEAFFGGK